MLSDRQNAQVRDATDGDSSAADGTTITRRTKSVKMIHGHPMMPAPESSGIMLMAGSWCPLLAVQCNIEAIGLVMSILVSCLAIVDYGVKIYGRTKKNDGPQRDDETAE